MSSDLLRHLQAVDDAIDRLGVSSVDVPLGKTLDRLRELRALMRQPTIEEGLIGATARIPHGYELTITVRRDHAPDVAVSFGDESYQPTRTHPNDTICEQIADAVAWANQNLEAVAGDGDGEAGTQGNRPPSDASSTPSPSPASDHGLEAGKRTLVECARDIARDSTGLFVTKSGAVGISEWDEAGGDVHREFLSPEESVALRYAAEDVEKGGAGAYAAVQHGWSVLWSVLERRPGPLVYSAATEVEPPCYSAVRNDVIASLIAKGTMRGDVTPTTLTPAGIFYVKLMHSLVPAPAGDFRQLAVNDAHVIVDLDDGEVRALQLSFRDVEGGGTGSFCEVANEWRCLASELLSHPPGTPFVVDSLDTLTRHTVIDSLVSKGMMRSGASGNSFPTREGLNAAAAANR